jgi:hypothetical protein
MEAMEHPLLVHVQIKPWKSSGSEVEVDALTTTATRESVVMTFERPREACARPNCIFVDKDAQEIHAMSSSHMDARPFKDPNYELQKVLLDTWIQAVPEVHAQAVQVQPSAVQELAPPLRKLCCHVAMLLERHPHCNFVTS